MNRPILAPIFTAICLLGASQSLLAAPKKADARNAELVAALQAVSPDPLGGRLGLAAATAQVGQPAAKTVAVAAPAGHADQLAYAQWKGGR